MITPDPITTAREALTKLNTMAEGWVATVFGSLEQNAAWDKRDAARLSITAALDYAEKLKAEREVTAYRNEAERTRVLLDQADTREKIAVSDVYDRDNIIRDLLKKVRDHEARVEELEGALAFYATEKNWYSPSSGFALQYDPEPSPIKKDWGTIARATLSKGIAKPTKP
jgi:hypothetical protein